MKESKTSNLPYGTLGRDGFTVLEVIASLAIFMIISTTVFRSQLVQGKQSGRAFAIDAAVRAIRTDASRIEASPSRVTVGDTVILMNGGGGLTEISRKVQLISGDGGQCARVTWFAVLVTPKDTVARLQCLWEVTQ